ncbi:MAG: deoxyguanosinetriphosphate triphosphohydrolase [Clostridiales bacterium]|nr:deoxyguanosinetriphosphate triphosphohydrolase [Clostridiales bacterium]
MKDFKSTTIEIQEKFLSPYACKDSDTKGRTFPLKPCPMRTEFQRDRDRILHSKAFRRLKHKTQVFLSPEGDHYRTRLTHTLEVSQIARTISRCLRLNEDLTEAIALGHDLGHTPYGHAGERALRKFTEFSHNEQSLRMVDCIENDGKGMNLTFEVRDGILNHTGKNKAVTLEGNVVAIADRIAYINHDIDDAIRANIIQKSDIPEEYNVLFGDTHSKRISSMIYDIINASYGKNTISQSDTFARGMDGLRQYLFDNVYTSPLAKSEEKKAIKMIEYLYLYFCDHEEKLPEQFRTGPDPIERRVCDFISTMSDRYAVRLFESITVPKNWSML